MALPDLPYCLVFLTIASILLIVAASWMLYNFDRLSNASDRNPNQFPQICDVDADSIKKGRKFQTCESNWGPRDGSH